LPPQSDPNKREVYDRYGEAGLKRGAGGMPGGYQFSGNAEDVFREFFGSGAAAGGLAGLFANAAMNGGGGSPFVFSMGPGGPQFSRGFGGQGSGGGGARGAGQRRGEQQLACTLEELYTGTVKRVASNGKTLEIEVKPGWKAGTKVNFEAEGVAYVIAERQHPAFTRHGNDLTHWCFVSPAQILTGSTQRIKTLDGRFLSVEFGPLAFFKVRCSRRAGPRRAARAAALGVCGRAVPQPPAHPPAARVHACAPLLAAQEVAREGMPVSRSRTGEKGSLRVYLTPLTPEQITAAKSWATIILCASQPLARHPPRARAGLRRARALTPCRPSRCRALRRCICAVYVFMNYSNLIVPLLMLFQLVRAGGFL
jgi:hypothetical protein